MKLDFVDYQSVGGAHSKHAGGGFSLSSRVDSGNSFMDCKKIMPGICVEEREREGERSVVSSGLMPAHPAI